jgi:hypothetical protein
MLSTAYRLQCDRIKHLALANADLASAQRLAVDEAFKTLSDPAARGRYDLKLRQLTDAPVTAMELIGEPSWFARNWSWITLLVALAAGSAYYYEESRREKLQKQEIVRQLAEKEAALRAEQEKVAAEQAAREQAAAELKAKMDRDREYAWQQQVRAQASYHAMQQDRMAHQQQQQALREKQMQERQQEAARLKLENEARMNLEREKQKLRMLECQRGAC